MKKNGKILAVVHHNYGADFLKLAARIADDSGSTLEVLVLHPQYPPEAEEVFDGFKKHVQGDIAKALADVKANIYFESQKPLEVSVIRHVLRGEHDLIIKEAEDSEQQKAKGFKSLDMALLRKCPGSVLLVKQPPKDGLKLAVAIDPISEEKTAHELNIKLLKEACLLGEFLGASFNVVSCWSLEYEDFLRNSPFANMSSEAVDELNNREQKRQSEALQANIKEAGLEGGDSAIQIKGKPEDAIPAYVEKQSVDILIMGTVARSGIEGFITGNTAENILQNLTCSMMAVKPGGFTCPVKAS